MSCRACLHSGMRVMASENAALFISAFPRACEQSRRSERMVGHAYTVVRRRGGTLGASHMIGGGAFQQDLTEGSTRPGPSTALGIEAHTVARRSQRRDERAGGARRLYRRLGEEGKRGGVRAGGGGGGGV
jgi:hypothetical protein